MDDQLQVAHLWVGFEEEFLLKNGSD